MKRTATNKPLKVGQKIWVDTHVYISEGSRDVLGGRATVTEITEGVSAGEKVQFVSVKEHPDRSYNWTQILSKKQAELKKEFGNKVAQADPDIDTPWIEKGDSVSLVDRDLDREGSPVW